MSLFEHVELEPLGDAAMRFALPPGLAPHLALATLRSIPGVIDAVVTDSYACFTFDPLGLPPDVRVQHAAVQMPHDDRAPVLHVVPVRYDGEDLDEVASRTGLSRDEVVVRHTERLYRVVFVGFMPGFSYLADLDERLRLARRETPRALVPARAVAIAGSRTAIYPFASPGGWHLIGTAANFSPFDPNHGATLAAGDTVRFTPV